MHDKYLRKLDVKLIDGEFENNKEKIRDPQHLYTTFQSLQDNTQETLIGVYFSSDLFIKSYSVLSIGSATQTDFSPHEIFKQVFITQSESFALIHNHPKGDPTPSPEDKLALIDIQKDMQSTIVYLYKRNTVTERYVFTV